MTPFETATAFFEALDTCQGWEGCQPYAAESGEFSCQADAIADITDLAAYCEWMKAVGTTALAGCRYELHASSYDESSRTAMFFGTFIATHVGEGGPVPPTGKETKSHYVYAITLNEDGKVCKLVKIWNSNWSLGELGWG